MKLVVCYSLGSDSDIRHETMCVEYESKDHFLVAFIDAFDAWAVARDGERQLERRLAAARSSQDTKKIEKAFAALLSYCGDHSISTPFTVDGWNFDSFNDWDTDANGVMKIYAMPYVYTLDEWFEFNRPEFVEQ